MFAPLVVAALAFAAVVTGQSPSPWSTLHVPAGVQSSRASSIGKLVTYRDGTTLHVYSAVTRRWHGTTIGSQATLVTTNDGLLVRDNGAWQAFSSYRGVFASLAVGAGATLRNGAGANNDSIFVVEDGSQLHAFSAFVGSWSSRTVTPGPLVAVQRHVAVLVDGTLLSAFDAATGNWHDRQVGAVPNSASADGTAGFAYGAGRIHAFSASHRTWSDAPEPPSPTFTRMDDWGLWHTATTTVGYSAPRGVFATWPTGTTAVIGMQDLFALVDTPAGIAAFSAFTGSWSPVLAPSGTAVVTSTATALLRTANDIRAYGAIANRARPHGNPGVNSGCANVVGWVADGTSGVPWFFSALTDRWHAAPAGVLPLDPPLTTTGAAALTANGCFGFSPRSGGFVPLVDPTITMQWNVSSAPLLAIGATRLHAFDPRYDRWVSTPRVAPGVASAQLWRTAGLVLDGGTAYAFGAQAGTWSSFALPGPWTAVRTNSESVRIQTSHDVIAWSALPEAIWLAQFPEFRRVQPAGVPVHASVTLPAGAIALLAIGVAASAPVSLPGLGDLLLAPASIVTAAVVAPASGEPLRVTWPGPRTAVPTTERSLQAAIWPVGGTPWLTEAAAVMFL